MDVNSTERWEKLQELLAGLGHEPRVIFEHRFDPEMDLAFGASHMSENPPAEAPSAFRRAWAKGWPDEPLPALGGKTPRQAAEDPTWCDHLEALLREFEYRASVNRERGAEDFDVLELRKELGMLVH